ncbi:UNKNOWN [Stylonychia lemnae]|uniref:Uncharacterized protein n=1 Tax=Stylonychia lemnae TaxID=5949 RepID=A0A078ALM6_STYLE|nr:UNKNOWN [Stylonychia lemnae]|eukprot:CDW82312.1 UNKNOWN [Stylonychia lemnae]
MYIESCNIQQNYSTNNAKDNQDVCNSEIQIISKLDPQEENKNVSFDKRKLDSKICGISLKSNKDSIVNLKETFQLIKDKNPMKIRLIKQANKIVKERKDAYLNSQPMNFNHQQHCQLEKMSENKYQIEINNTEEMIEKIRKNLSQQIPRLRRNGNSILSDNRDKEYLYINPSIGKQYKSYDENGHRYLRSDILYNSITRDMRRFYIQDFNAVTEFILEKNKKCDDHFFIY